MRILDSLVKNVCEGVEWVVSFGGVFALGLRRITVVPKEEKFRVDFWNLVVAMGSKTSGNKAKLLSKLNVKKAGLPYI